ncbi:MAG: hypothetical protein EXR28_04705 [Betaproteobacteria bacterium]|nr:hypothetical protein [Betaproteobacteria bacterium]
MSEIQGRSQNQIVNEAVRELVSKRAQEVEANLKSTLARLKAYRLHDPTGEKSMAAAMKAEAAIDYDPAKGVRVLRSNVVRSNVAGPASTRMLDSLRG